MIQSYQNKSQLDKVPCRHPQSITCTQNALKASLKSLKFGAAIRYIINLLKFLLRLTKKQKPNFLSFLFEQRSLYNVRIPISFFFYTFLLRYVYCILRRYRNKQDNWNALAAGIVSGFGMMILLPRQNWHFMIMLIGTRVFDGIYKLMINAGWFKERGINYYIIFLLGSMVMSHGYFFEQDVVDSQVIKVYDRMSVLDVNQRIWHGGILLHSLYEFKKKGYKFFNNNLQKIALKKLPIQ